MRCVLVLLVVLPLVACLAGCGSGSSSASRTWSAPVLFSALHDGWQDSQLVSDSSNRMQLVWKNPSAQEILASTFAGSTWSAPAAISDVSYSIWLAKIDMNAGGNAVALWNTRSSGDAYEVLARSYTPASGWAASTNSLTSLSVTAYAGDVSINSAGDAIAVYPQNDATGHIWSCLRPDGEAWGTATRLDSTTFSCASPRVAMDLLGNAVAVWKYWNDSRYRPAARFHSASTSWDGAATDLDGDLDPGLGTLDYSLDVELNAAGNGLIHWTLDDRTAVVVRRIVGGALTVAKTIATGTNIYWSAAKVAPDGRIILLWHDSQNLWASTCVDGVWDAAPTLLSEETPTFGEQLRTQVLAMDHTNGRCIALWTRILDDSSDPNSGSAVWARWYDPTSGWSADIDTAVPWTADIWFDVDAATLGDDGTVMAILAGEDPQFGYSTYTLTYR